MVDGYTRARDRVITCREAHVANLALERDRPTGVVCDVPELERGPGSFIGLAIGAEQNEVLE